VKNILSLEKDIPGKMHCVFITTSYRCFSVVQVLFLENEVLVTTFHLFFVIQEFWLTPVGLYPVIQRNLLDCFGSFAIDDQMKLGFIAHGHPDSDQDKIILFLRRPQGTARK
jgi:hypothetical protein